MNRAMEVTHKCVSAPLCVVFARRPTGKLTAAAAGYLSSELSVSIEFLF